MAHIAVIDYGMGNLRSVEKAFTHVGVQAFVSSDETLLWEADALVLPGVGAFAACMKALAARGFDKLVRERARLGTPMLGLCVGMQMLFEESEEFGKSEGLALLGGRVRRFSEDLILPQVGWNQVQQRRVHPLFEGIEDNTFFYFVHSYYCEPKDSENVIGVTEYGTTYASVVAQNHVCGAQFHPEKSQTAGLRLLSNFSRLAERC
ncbi:MAG TPA: imidazole glycerol phosphate synthase subunit HisH [Pyrinomonadaceae bacterium]|nr:imidazole glycerol phosphate synthase subunit HisH [Pyrinomonadaceae bacterium]